MYFVCWRIFTFVCLFFAVCRVFSRYVCQYSFVLCLILRVSTRWRLVLSTIRVISWWIVIWSQDNFSFFFVVFRLTFISFILSWAFKNMFKMYYNTTEIESFFTDGFKWTSFDKISVPKNQVTTGLRVEMSVRHDFWVFDVSFTKKIRIMIMPLIFTNLINWRLRMSKFENISMRSSCFF